MKPFSVRIVSADEKLPPFCRFCGDRIEPDHVAVSLDCLADADLPPELCGDCVARMGEAVLKTAKVFLSAELAAITKKMDEIGLTIKKPMVSTLHKDFVALTLATFAPRNTQ